MTFQVLQQQYLEAKGKTLETASKAMISDAISYASCYDWYITKQLVSDSTADLAAKVWVNKYALHDKNGVCRERTLEDTWKRIAKTLAEVESCQNNDEGYDKWYDIFLDALQDFKYAPGGSGLYSIGNPYTHSSVSNCFVMNPPQDNLESIFDVAKSMARVYANRGGCGVDISNLRPYNAPTNNAAKSSTGAASFMDFYSYVTGKIGQEGRRGALLMSLRIDHPDIFRFIKMKRDEDKQWFLTELEDAGIDLKDYKYAAIADRLKSCSQSNVSVKVTDKFISALENDEMFELWFEYDNGYPRYSEFVKAKDIWDALIEGAWASAEPGMFNWDHILRESISGQYDGVIYNGCRIAGKEITSNPCGEIVMPPDSCNLGQMYLPAFVERPYTPEAYFNWAKYEKYAAIAVRMQDNIKQLDIDSDLLLPEHQLSAEVFRRLGLGNTGYGDMFAMLNIKYGDDTSIACAENIAEVYKEVVYNTSVDLAIEKGAFPIFNWELHKNSPFIQRLKPETQERIKTHGIRNVAMLTQAPNGTGSILCRNTTSGLEPMFFAESNRNIKNADGSMTRYVMYHQGIEDCKLAGGDPSIYVAAHDVSYEKKIELQAVMQKHIDHSISVTANLPADISKEEIGNLYLKAFKLGCKGFTVYREGSRGSVLSALDEKKIVRKSFAHPLERPKTTEVDIHKVKYRDKPWSVLIGKFNGLPIEVFAGVEEDTPLPNKYYKAELTKKSKGHYSLTVYLSADSPEDIIKINNIGARFPSPEGLVLTRFISLSLRNRITISDIVEQLQKSANSMFDYPAVLARVLKQYASDEELAAKIKGTPCPDCGQELKIKRESGCSVVYCESCNYVDSKCG